MAKGKYESWISATGQRKLMKLAAEGYTDRELAHYMGISESTFYEWMKKYAEISESIKRGKDRADTEVVNALFKSATGYYVEESISEKGGATKTTKKWIKPDTAAQIFWLKNRRAGEWRDKVTTETEQDDKTLSICIIPPQNPVAPPPELTDRDDIIKYYENQFNTDCKDYLEEYGN